MMILMKLEEIYEMWENDAKYDDLNLDTESLNISSLHAKYNRLLSETRSQLRACFIQRKSRANLLRDYYRGNLNNPDDLERIGRPPFLQGGYGAVQPAKPRPCGCQGSIWPDPCLPPKADMSFG